MLLDRLSRELPPHVPLQPFADVPKREVSRPDVRIAAILDEMSFRCWQYEAELVPLEPHDWRRRLEERRPDLLLVESAWSGPGGKWGRLLAPQRRLRRPLLSALRGILRWCRRRDIPTVFHAKEDPVDLEIFLDSARLFDFVFTTDRLSEGRYARGRSAPRVGSLPFAAQPKLHNPGRDPLERPGSVVFAGAWYALRHPERRRDAQALLGPALDHGLEIWDRSASADPQFEWPEPFRDAVVGSLPYALMVRANQRYKVGLNLNTVTGSPTMLSRRVFELLAGGACVLSSPSRAIRALLGDDVVYECSDPDSTRRELECLLEDPLRRERRAARGLRTVFEEHTYALRMARLLEATGITSSEGAPRVDAVAPVSTEEEARRARAHFARQAYPGKGQLLVCSPDGGLRVPSDEGEEPVRVCTSPEGAWGAALARGLEQVSAPRVALMHPDHHYGRHYLSDQAHAAQWAGDGPIAKPANGFVALAEGRVRREAPPTAAPPVWSLLLERSRARELARRLSAVRTLPAWGEELVKVLEPVAGTYPFEYARPAAGAQRAELGGPALADVTL